MTSITFIKCWIKHPSFQAIHAVRTHELRAYVIYVKPPPLERLRETRQEAFITTNYYVNRPFKVNCPTDTFYWS